MNTWCTWISCTGQASCKHAHWGVAGLSAQLPHALLLPPTHLYTIKVTFKTQSDFLSFFLFCLSIARAALKTARSSIENYNT